MFSFNPLEIQDDRGWGGNITVILNPAGRLPGLCIRHLYLCDVRDSSTFYLSEFRLDRLLKSIIF